MRTGLLNSACVNTEYLVSMRDAEVWTFDRQEWTAMDVKFSLTTNMRVRKLVGLKTISAVVCPIRIIVLRPRVS